MASAAWQRKEGKSASGGLNKRGVASGMSCSDNARCCTEIKKERIQRFC